MNDRLRFRAWDNFEKKMISWDECLKNESLIAEFLLNEVRYKAMQCTGLKDKNGRLIYEGDFLINHDGNIGFIEFKYAGFMLTAINEDNIMSTQDWTECEVIGNIHENADLLEEKSEKPIF